MNRVVLLGAVGLAVIIAALALNYAITREEAVEAPVASLQAVPDAVAARPSARSGGASGSSAAGPAAGEAVARKDKETDRASADGDVPTRLADLGSSATAPATAPGVPQVRPDFDVVQINPSGGMVMAGRAAPNSDVTVVRDGKPIGTVTADNRGEWVLVPGASVEPGSHEFGVTASLPGAAPVASEDVVVVVVPEPKKDIAGRPRERTGGSLALALPRNGEGGATVLQAPPAATDGRAGIGAEARGEGIADGSLVLDSLTYDAEGSVTVGGRAEPGTNMRVYLGEAEIGSATADAEGRWQATADQPVPEGLHQLRVEQVEPGGEVVARVESPFLRTDAAEPVDGSVVVQPGNSLWRIARRIYGRGIRYTLIFTANDSQIDDPDLIYPGQVFVIPPLIAGPR